MAHVALVVSIRLPFDVHIAVHVGTTCSTIGDSRGTTRMRLQMQPHMLVEIAGIAKRSQAELALQRLESGVGAYVDLQAIFPGVHLAAVDAQMTLLGGTHIADYGLDLGSCIHWIRRQRCSGHRHGGQVG